MESQKREEILNASESSVDQDRDCILRIKQKQRKFDTKEELEKFLTKQLAKIGTFTGIQCSQKEEGNSYGYEPCVYLAQVIQTQSSN